jgi:hypothetical protein
MYQFSNSYNAINRLRFASPKPCFKTISRLECPDFLDRLSLIIDNPLIVSYYESGISFYNSYLTPLSDDYACTFFQNLSGFLSHLLVLHCLATIVMLTKSIGFEAQ